MRDFSLDLESEKIHSAKIKEYFQEVIKSYYNDNYRSAVVMLYSVTLCDLFLKLKSLKDIYNDEASINILNNIEDLQRRNPNSPDWENKLIELIKEQTNLLEPADYLNITNLQKHRHLCAHPIITQNYELYRPNKETVRAHIRNMLEGLLIKPPLLSRKIFDDLLIDISENSQQLLSDKDLERYLNAKYFRNINIHVEKQIFKALWKIVFRLNSEQANKNRDINFRTIKVLFKRHYLALIEEVELDRDYFSKLDQISIKEIVVLLNAYPDVYELFNDEAKMLIEKEVSGVADLKAIAWFLTKDIQRHVDYIFEPEFQENLNLFETYVSSQTILELMHILKDQVGRFESYQLAIKFFGMSDSYSTADTRFQHLIKPYLHDLDNKQLEHLIRVIDSNSQIYDRRLAYNTNIEVKKVIQEKFHILISQNIRIFKEVSRLKNIRGIAPFVAS